LLPTPLRGGGPVQLAGGSAHILALREEARGEQQQQIGKIEIFKQLQ
jgi:hypothetical protein